MIKNNPKKSLGQNFLKSPRYAQIAVDNLDINLNDQILEIGPGYGALTSHILRHTFAKLTLVEFDRDLIDNLHFLTVKLVGNNSILSADELNANFTSDNKISIVNANILDYNFGTVNKIIGAIPYNISSPLIHKLINLKVPANTIVLIVQKEVGQKFCDRNANYFNCLSFFYDKKIICEIKNDQFYPVPKVDSVIIKFDLNITQYQYYCQVIGDFALWSKFLHQVFRFKRKMINKNFSSNILILAKIDPTLRAHQLSLEQIINLFKITKNVVN